MKRNNIVLNRAAIQRGRRIARWAAAGMNIGDGREAVVMRGKALLCSPTRLQEFDRALSAAQRRLDQEPAVVTQSTVMVALGFW
jgi:hypothetical protein